MQPNEDTPEKPENEPPLQPQLDPTPTTGLYPAPAAAPGPSANRGGSSKVPYVVLALVVLGAAAGTFLALNAIKSKDKTLRTAQSELETAKQELEAANAKKGDTYNSQKMLNDTKRKNDLAVFMGAVNEYVANNNGKFPSTEPGFFAKDFEANYVTGKLRDFNDPNTKKPYKFITVPPVHTPPGVTLGTIQYQWPGECAGSEFEDTKNMRAAAARLILESGEIYCIDN